MENKDVFISYSRHDSPVADKICEALDRAGVSYFIDRQGIGGGMEFPEILAEAIMGCRLFLFLASSNSYSSKFTNSEITFAFNEKPKNSLLPYIIDNSSLPVGVKFVFSGINWRNIKDHPIDTVLVDDICRLLGKKRKGSATIDSSISQDESPEDLFKKGWSAYDKKDFVEAAKCFRKAAEQDYAPAQFNLGFCYRYGKGINKDFIEAKKWYRTAAKWYRRAAEQGDTKAQFNLGICFKYFLGTAENWFRKAAEKGYAPAQCELGLYYKFGIEVEKDIIEAVKWYRKAAEQGVANAQFNLGECYELGQGEEKNCVEAMKWYRRAAEQGFAAAQFNLGGCYLFGDEGEKNSDEALKWLRKAAEQGYSSMLKFEQNLDFEMERQVD